MTEPARLTRADQVWFTVPEAAAYLRQSLRQFNRLRIEANGSGARKVYHRDALDAWMFAHPWQPSENAVPRGSLTGAKTENVSDALLERLRGKRLRPYRPRKTRNSTASSNRDPA